MILMPIRTLRALAPLLVMILAACSRTHVATSAAPRTIAASVPELAIYRTVAESMYVRTTGKPVGIVVTSTDTTCVAGAVECPSLATRWGLDPIWWASDTTMAYAARRNLLARAADTLDLRAVALGSPNVVAVAPDSTPTDLRDVNQWVEFRDKYDGAAGFLRFSPVGFDDAKQAAIVYVQWECGPSCGHTLSAALHLDAATSQWRISDLMLISSRASAENSAPSER